MNKNLIPSALTRHNANTFPGVVPRRPDFSAPARSQVPASVKLALTAQTTEGPYYLADTPLRADITEGLPGVPLELLLTVRDPNGMTLPGCRVDIWQCDAGGLYSGYAGQGDDRTVSEVGKTYLRGGQISNARGEVRFRSIYPGWYAGRTTHIHFKVQLLGRSLVTSQFFMPDAMNEFLYTQLPQYRRSQVRNVVNRTDGIAVMAGPTVIGSVQEERDRYVAQLSVVVDPTVDVPAHRPGPGSGPPPGAVPGRGGPPPGFGGVPALKAPEGAARVRALVPGQGVD